MRDIPSAITVSHHRPVMPGKYSHSVVLADYSSRGIISLPPDQHSKYVESMPLKSKPSVSQLRILGTRSAHAVYHDNRVRKSGRPSPLDQRYLASASPTPPPPKHCLDVIANENTSNDFNPMRYSRYYEQMMPKSTPVVNLTVQTSEQELRTAYRRQQHANSNIVSMPQYPRPVAQGRGQRTGPDERLHSPVIRDSHSHASLRKDAAAATATNRPPASKQVSSVGTHSSNPRAVSTPQMLHRFSPSPQGRPQVSTPGKRMDSNHSALSQDRSRAKPLPTEGRLQPGKGRQVFSEYFPDHTVSSRSPSTLQTRLYESEYSGGRSSKSPILLEPDFDGFSDESPSVDFDGNKGPVVHSRSSSLNSMLPIQRPDSSNRPSSQGQQSSNTATTLPKMVGALNGDRNSPSRTTESSVKTSTRAHRSNSSVSSVSISNIHSQLGTGKHSFEGSRKVNQSSPADPSWRLPEISEDHGFSPSIFEDKEGPQEELRMEEFDIGTTMGQISSGRDVTFDNSDAISELSAALPPPITRFRDEEDEFNANMTRLFGDGGDYAINKKGSHTIGRSATKKTKGFFSKFRSKS